MTIVLPTNATTEIVGGKTFIDWVQEASNGLFMPSMLVGIFVILFSLLRLNTSNGKAFVGSSFICMVFAIIFSTLGWLSPGYMYASIIITAIGAVWSYMDNKVE